MTTQGQHTWADVEAAARHDPVLFALCHQVRRGVSREDALIDAVLFLVNNRKELVERIGEFLSHNAFPPAG